MTGETIEQTSARTWKRWARIQATTGTWPHVIAEIGPKNSLVRYEHLADRDPLDVFETWRTKPDSHALMTTLVAGCELTDGRTVPVRAVLVVDRDGNAGLTLENKVTVTEAVSVDLYAAMVAAFDRTTELDRELLAMTGGGQ